MLLCWVCECVHHVCYIIVYGCVCQVSSLVASTFKQLKSQRAEALAPTYLAGLTQLYEEAEEA